MSRGARLYQAAVRWSFERLYCEGAWAYDTVAWSVSRGLWPRWTQAALPYLRGNVLELGCGTGHVQAALAQVRAGTGLGLDASPTMLALTRRRLSRMGLPTCLVQAVAQRLPFPDASFSSVVATFPSEYLVQPATLAEVQRILRPAGRLVIVDAAAFLTRGLYTRLVDQAYRLTLHSSVQHDDDLRWQHPYLTVLASAGFTVDVHRVHIDHSRVLVFVGHPHGP